MTQGVEHGAVAHQIGFSPESWDAGLRGRRRHPVKLAAGRDSFPKNAIAGWNKPLGREARQGGDEMPPRFQHSASAGCAAPQVAKLSGWTPPGRGEERGNGARSPVEHCAGSRDGSFAMDPTQGILRTGGAGSDSHAGCEPGLGAAALASAGAWAETRKKEHILSGLHRKRQGAPHKRSVAKGVAANAEHRLQESLRPRPEAGQTGQPQDGLPELPNAARERRRNARAYSSSSLYLTRSPSWKGTQKSSSPLSCSSSRTAQT